eukprot:CAMPEP_0201655224 /NCGR_PEP_ID=MMETSP0493-20130528/45904_1 /ASSEMBLY_ACC=CAM_ASM_000838 /TAXON_ID=420259 /ORGANISM="Thalassiosira gravida, Strain GMp14c1" /LENGTH=159 /DNA_ID=CAMNT_0048131803 /DNA_START=577 /DNA_END=1056 /DNA_ORIENTATION=-
MSTLPTIEAHALGPSSETSRMDTPSVLLKKLVQELAISVRLHVFLDFVSNSASNYVNIRWVISTYQHVWTTQYWDANLIAVCFNRTIDTPLQPFLYVVHEKKLPMRFQFPFCHSGGQLEKFCPDQLVRDVTFMPQSTFSLSEYIGSLSIHRQFMNKPSL